MCMNSKNSGVIFFPLEVLGRLTQQTQALTYSEHGISALWLDEPKY